jgi:hypothetical protein
MDFPVILFSRDKTVDVSPHHSREPVPLGFVQYYAHHTEHDVWSVGNQTLQIEAAIPTSYEARDILNKNGISTQYVPAGGHKNTEDRVKLIEKLYHEIFESKCSFVIVGCDKYSDFKDTNWQRFNSEEFVKYVQESKIEEPNLNIVSGNSYFNTNEHGTYKSMTTRLDNSLN